MQGGINSLVWLITSDSDDHELADSELANHELADHELVVCRFVGELENSGSSEVGPMAV